MRTDILKRKKEILEWIKKNKSKSYICKELDCKPDTLNLYLVKMKIEYSGNQGGKGIKIDKKRMTALEYVKSSTHIKSNSLKKKLIEEGYKEHKCEECMLIEWNGESIPIELHHIDGDKFNNNFYNLQILCPNCHAQTNNYKGKNIKIEKIIYKCKDCDNNIQKNSIRCNECSKKHIFNNKKIKKETDKNWRSRPKLSQRRVDRPSYEVLKKEVDETNYSAVGRKYGVSDNAIRKWIKQYEK
jgi:Zn finger protein HypA/HybF involved in hydrogenase expression